MLDLQKLQNDILLFSPWLSRIVLSLPVEADASCPTAGTDGRMVIYNPDWFEALSHNHRMGVLVHEYLHVLLGHHVRQGERELERWNISADYELNPYVIAAGYSLPPEALLPPAEWKDKEAEWIYPRLPTTLTAPQWDYLQGSQANTIEEREAAKQAWKELVASVDKSALPASLARALTDKLTPRRTVADAIASYLSLALDEDTETWAPCSRRCSLLPSQPECPDGHVIIAIDTSGSMSDENVRDCLREVLGVAQISRVDVLYADAAVQSVHEDVKHSNLSMPKGGGGTDFRPALAEITRRQPDIAVYLTDGQGTYGAPQPGIVWASPMQPPWGQWINIENLARS